MKVFIATAVLLFFFLTSPAFPKIAAVTQERPGYFSVVLIPGGKIVTRDASRGVRWSTDGAQLAYLGIRELGFWPMESSLPIPIPPDIDPEGIVGWIKDEIFFTAFQGGFGRFGVFKISLPDGAISWIAPAASEQVDVGPDGEVVVVSYKTLPPVGNEFFNFDYFLSTGRREINPEGIIMLECPRWSPDGTRIAFVGDGKTLYVVTKDGNDVKRVANLRPGAYLAWNGSGTILFSSFSDQGGGLFSVPADGSEAPRLVATGRFVDFDAFSDQAEFGLAVPRGVSFTHLPLKVSAIGDKTTSLKNISDLFDALEGTKNVNQIITYLPPSGTTPGRWVSYLGTQSKGSRADQAITDDLGIITVMKNPVTLRLKGDALGTDGKSQIKINAGNNLVGVPLKDAKIQKVSDLLNLDGIKGNATAIIVSDNGTFRVVAQAGDPGDISITGGQSFIVTARAAGTAEITGEAWDNVSVSASAAPPMAIVGHQVNEQTPVLEVHGAVVDEITGQAKDGFSITVKNLSTGASLKALTNGEVAEGSYSITFVDAASSRAVRIGDVLEITAQTPSSLIGVQPLRHIVTTDDVKKSQISLANLIAYEIPAKTELRPNYPNPFNPETWIPFRLAKDAAVTLTIYDTTGKVVRTIPVGFKPAAVYESKAKAIYWDGRNDFGEHVASGIYFYHLTAGDFSATRKMLVLK